LSNSKRLLVIFQGLVVVCLLLAGTMLLLEATGFTFLLTVHRVTSPKVFDPFFSLEGPIIFFLLLWGLLYYSSGIDFMIIVPLAGLLFAPFLGIEIGLGFMALIAGIVGLLRWKCWFETAISGLSLLGVLEALALIHWTLLAFGFQTALIEAALLETEIYYLLSIFAPIPVLVIFFGWILHRYEKPVSKNDDKPQGFTRWNWFLLVSSIAIAFFATLYPYLSSVNPHGLLVGYDFTYYLESAQSVLVYPSQIFSKETGGRPVVFLFIYLLQKISSQDLYSVLWMLPMLLLPFTVVSIGLMSWEITNNGWISSWASFFSATSVFIVEFMYGYFLGNMFGLCFACCFLATLFRGLKTGHVFNYILSGIFGLLFFFSHPYTFDLYFSVLIITLIFLLYYEKSYSTPEIHVILIFLLIFGLFEVAGNSILGRAEATDAFIALLKTLTIQIRLNFLEAGFTSNTILLSLAAFGAWEIKADKIPKLYLQLLLAISGLGFIFLNDMFRFRLLIDLPLGIFAALGFENVLNYKRLGKARFIIICFIVLFMLVYLLRSLANLI